MFYYYYYFLWNHLKKMLQTSWSFSLKYFRTCFLGINKSPFYSQVTAGLLFPEPQNWTNVHASLRDMGEGLQHHAYMEEKFLKDTHALQQVQRKRVKQKPAVHDQLLLPNFPVRLSPGLTPWENSVKVKHQQRVTQHTDGALWAKHQAHDRSLCPKCVMRQQCSECFTVLIGLDKRTFISLKSQKQCKWSSTIHKLHSLILMHNERNKTARYHFSSICLANIKKFDNTLC